MHPDMQVLLDARDKSGPMGESTEQQRAFWGAYTTELNEPAPSTMTVTDESVPGDATVPVRLYRPAAADRSAAVIMYLHGGGFMLGDLDSSDAIAWGFAEQTGAVVASVDYRLTPEHVYPAAADDCWRALSWLCENTERLGIDPQRVLVAGDSAGGNLAAVMALKARDRAGPAIRAVAIIYPATSLDNDLPSAHVHAQGPGLTREAMIKYRHLYLPDSRHDNDPYAVPAAATDFSGLPPFWIHTAEFDPIRDDGRLFASKLAMAGTDVSYREARGMIHGFMRARFKGAGARREYDLLCRFLAEHM